MSGNDYGTEVSIGRLDAMNGLLLQGDGKGNFRPLSINKSGIYIPGNAKALVKLRSSKGGYLIAASQNRDKLKLFSLQTTGNNISLDNQDIGGVVHLKNGKTRKEEFYFGSGFLSQSSRFFRANAPVQQVEIIDEKARRKTVANMQ
jgi:hypothetical protein